MIAVGEAPARVLMLSEAARENLIARSAGVELATAEPLFALPAEQRTVVEQIRAELRTRGYAVVGGFPVGRLGPRAAAAFWIWSSLLGRPMLQNLQGQRIDVVRNEGAATVRGAKTDRELIFHTDFANSAPDVFGLLTVHQARAGGDSLLSDGHAVARMLREQDQPAYDQLRSPFLVDRTGDVTLDREQIVGIPVIGDGEETPRLCYNRARIHRGHRYARRPLTAAQARALDRFDELLAGSAQRLRLEAGQAIFIDNHRMLHSRTAFTDWDDLSRRRELLRVWLRQDG